MSAIYGCSKIEEYTVGEKIGNGTFGEVCRGIHKTTGAVVALKEIILHDNYDGIPITALREVRILKFLNHENVIDLLDVAVKKKGSRKENQRSVFFMVTPYMDHDLNGLFKNKSFRLTIPQIKCYFEQILQGVNYIHQLKIMHRDIKSANVLVDNLGQVKLADFGLARRYLEAPPTVNGASPATIMYTQTVVTRWYRSLELTLGERYYTTAIDMWSVGCLFGEMFLKTPIFRGDDDTDQMVRIVQMMGAPSADYLRKYANSPIAKLIPIVTERKFEKTFGNIPSPARSLLEGLLDYEPLTRLTALGALQHEFFTTGPPPCAKSELPIYKSSHEFVPPEKRVLEDDRPSQANGRDWRDGYKQFRPFQRRPQRPILSGIDLIPPYRRSVRENRLAPNNREDAAGPHRLGLDY